MYNYIKDIKEYAEKLFRNPLARSIAVTSAVAPLILLPQADKDRAEERFLGIFNSGVPAQEQQLEESHMPWKRELVKIEKNAEEFARLSTEADMEDSRTRADFLIENGYTEKQCEQCKWLESPEAKRLYEKAKKYGVEEIAYGLPSRESDYRQFDSNGNPLKSEKGAVGKLQLLGEPRTKDGKKKKNGGFNEVWHIFNDPLPHQKKFIEKYKKSIEEDAHLLCGTEDEVYKRLHHNESANETAGYVYTGLLKFINRGNINLTLEMYVAGGNGRKRYPNNARKYRKAVLSRQKKWYNLKENVCPEMESRYKAFQERCYQTRKSNYLAANQGY